MKKKRYVRGVKRRPARRKQSIGGLAVVLGILLLLVMVSTAFRITQKLDLERAERGTIKDISEGNYVDVSEGSSSGPLAYEDIPEYEGSPYCIINDGVPGFTAADREILSVPGYEYYSALDSTGRCGYCEACVGPETQPEGEERGEIWEVHPSGWRSGQGWERCHLIAWALTGENANDHNLVTGTHSMNVDGMLPFEIQTAEAADAGKHIMYRVTPIYKGAEPICRGVHMMAQSVEDDSVRFNVFVYNVEPGKTIDYVLGYIL